jgi:hypothetical protein
MPDAPDHLTGRATVNELAAVLTEWSAFSASGERVIYYKLINSWYLNRHNSGMPEAVGLETRGGRRLCRVWNVAEVLEWYLGWVPSQGGAPIGNQNNLRHGEYRNYRNRERKRKP